MSSPWLVWRNIVLIVRHDGFLIATAVHLVALTSFVLIWGDGVPIWRDDPVLVQFSRLDLVLLAVILPWVAIRCSPDAGHDSLVQLSAATACSPARIIVARTAGVGCALVTLVLSALPMFVMAQQISALPASMVWRALVPALTLAVLVAVIATAANVFLRGRLSSWLVATAATVVIVSATPTAARGVSGILAIAAVVAVLLVMSADRRLRYLSEFEHV
jgi:hypothetical protein